MANQLGCPFYETSAALRQFIDDAFYSLVKQIRSKDKSRVMIPRKRNRWLRIRSVFAFIFRKKKRQSDEFHPSP